MKTKIYLIAIIGLTLLCFIGCNDDKPKNYPPQITLTNANPDILAVSGTVTFTATVIDKNGLKDIVSVTINLVAIGGDPEQKLFDDGTNGDVTPKNGVFTFAYEVPTTVQYNIYNLTITATDKKNQTSTAKVQVMIYTGTQIHVAPTGYPLSNIQDGIDAAVAGDLVLVHNGIYTGARNRNLTFNGKEIFVRSENGPEFTIIDCEGSDVNPGRRGFRFSNGEGAKSILDGFTIKNGWTDFGGAGMLFENNSSPTIKNCVIMDCTATASKEGGAIYLENNCSPYFLFCTFKNNVSYDNGGAVYVKNNAIPVFQSCVFDSNTAWKSGGAFMIDNNAGVTLYNCLVINNYAREHGGAFYSKHGFLTIESSTISSNKANRDGGGLMTESSAETTALNTIFWGNISDYDADSDGEGNEFFVKDSTYFIRLTNCLFSDLPNDVIDTGNRIITITDCLNENPLFVNATVGDYHLQHKAAGQANNSPCIDAGSADVTAFEYLAGGSTTRTDNKRDEKIVDIGYHYFP